MPLVRLLMTLGLLALIAACGKFPVYSGPEVTQIVVNNAALIRAMLAEGGCYALLPDFTVREALGAGTLAIACPDWAIPDVEVHALYTERRTALTSARAFVEAVLEELKAVSHT